MRPTDESCELCHWPPSFHSDSVREIIHFQGDQENTETRTYLILKTGGGEIERGQGYGIHWHIENQVEFISNGHNAEEIPWVRATFPDGTVVEYNDVTDPLSEEEIAEAEIHVMECIDCHNRIGHPFDSPEELIDQALAEGRLSTELPYVKAEMLALLAAEYESREAALEHIDVVQARIQEYQPGHAFDMVISRAVSSLEELYRQAQHLLAPGSRMFFMKGALPEAEMTALAPAHETLHVERLCVPGLDAQRHLIWLDKLEQ